MIESVTKTCALHTSAFAALCVTLTGVKLQSLLVLVLKSTSREPLGRLRPQLLLSHGLERPS